MSVTIPNKIRLTHVFDLSNDPIPHGRACVAQMLPRLRLALLHLAAIPADRLQGLDADIDLLHDVTAHYQVPGSDLLDAIDRIYAHTVILNREHDYEGRDGTDVVLEALCAARGA
jgi:hypothetical protein